LIFLNKSAPTNKGLYNAGQTIPLEAVDESTGGFKVKCFCGITKMRKTKAAKYCSDTCKKKAERIRRREKV